MDDKSRFLASDIYYFADAESHFNLQHYERADTLYRMMLDVCYPKEKADAYYRIGFCSMFAENWQEACDNFKLALQHYEQHRNTPDLQARITQLQKMIGGLEKQLQQAQREEIARQIEQQLPLLLQLSKKHKADGAPQLDSQHVEQPQGKPHGNTAAQGTESIGDTTETTGGQTETDSHQTDSKTDNGNKAAAETAGEQMASGT